MKDLVVDLKWIENKSKDKLHFENFKSKVKKIPIMEFDQLAEPFIHEVTSSIDCTLCGNCCKVQEPGVNEDEIARLALLKNMELADFKKEYVATDMQQVSFLCKQPCVFLNGTICSIYHDRPGSCVDFPGLHRPGLKWRMRQLEENYAICPIVFNVVEKLNALLE